LKTIIDYIITKQDLKLKIQDVRAYRGTNCRTDHKLLVAKILFSYMQTATDKHEEKKENMETMVDKNRKYNTESLQNESTKFLYQQRLINKLNQNELADRVEMYNYLKKCIHGPAKKHWEKRRLTKERKQCFELQR
jgi:hypothetical protein